MASKKKYDAAVKVGSYTVNGEEKSRWLNVGTVMVNDEGKPYMFMNRTFNPAGVPNPDGREDFIISFFEPSEKAQAAPARQQAAAPPKANISDEDKIPF